MQEVATTQNTLPISAAEMAEWGTKEVTSNDLIIPKILLMQGLSVMVTEGKAQLGDFRDSLTGKLVGRYDNAPFEVIPFMCNEVFSIQKKDAQSGQFVYSHTEPIVKNPQRADFNDNAPWEDKVMLDGTLTDIKRIRRYDFLVLLKSDLDSGEAVMPYLLSFKSTSVKEGKKLFNMMYVRNKAAGLLPASYMFSIAGRKEKNDKGIFIVPTVEQTTRTSPAHVKAAFDWFKRLSTTAFVAHEEDETQEPAASDSSATGEF